MSDDLLDAVRALLARCSHEQEEVLFRELRRRHSIHEFELAVGAPAEMILDALHRAPELTRRMLRGVIADAAFRTFVIPSLQSLGWHDITPAGNFAFDYLLEDSGGRVSVQVKLQRSERGQPVVRPGKHYGLENNVYITETQKTRTGNDRAGGRTRPYRYGEFDLLAVSMQPSTHRWDKFMYTLGRWLLPGKGPGEIATLQPVAMGPNEFWTEDFTTAVKWLRMDDQGKRMGLPGRPPG